MSKGTKKNRFLGYSVTRWQQNFCIIGLIEMTVGRFGVHKRTFKTEAQFWAVIEKVTGQRPFEGETLPEAISRIAKAFRTQDSDKRAAIIASLQQEEILALFAGGRQAREPRLARPSKTKVKPRAPTVGAKDEFYKSWEWRTLRMRVLKEHGRSCQCCGAAPGMTAASGEPVRICVDHIKPLSKFWHLRLDRTNLQVLCDECNQGKGNWDETDFRPPQAPDEWLVEGDEPPSDIIEQLSDRTSWRLQ